VQVSDTAADRAAHKPVANESIAGKHTVKKDMTKVNVKGKFHLVTCREDLDGE
jgi:hypothetical protein